MPEKIPELIWYIFAAFVAGGLFLLVLRFITGKTKADRIVALDVMTTIVTSSLVLCSLFFERVIYLDVALVYAVLAYVTVLSVARFLERGL